MHKHNLFWKNLEIIHEDYSNLNIRQTWNIIYSRCCILHLMQVGKSLSDHPSERDFLERML